MGTFNGNHRRCSKISALSDSNGVRSNLLASAAAADAGSDDNMHASVMSGSAASAWDSDDSVSDSDSHMDDTLEGRLLLAKNEHKLVNRWRRIFICTLLLVFGLLAATTDKIMKQENEISSSSSTISEDNKQSAVPDDSSSTGTSDSGGNNDDSAVVEALTMSTMVFFAMLMFIFFCYLDKYVRQRHDVVVEAANRSREIVDSLFPANVRDRILNERANAKKIRKSGTSLKGFLMGDEKGAYTEDGDGENDADDDGMFKTKPIADLFPDTTVLFGDIVGFTSWSSVREPSSVFQLLETVYRAFDQIAEYRRIFKVETIGDCYVAVCGLPDPRRDHAVNMARFARDCMLRFRSLTKGLEVTLGPDTADLSMRIGMHSGPVTAGVLRGERARFQLFGDTVNTAARMESTGERSAIHISPETADLLKEAGKSAWVKPREDKIHAKGKGLMQTYWLDIFSNGELNSSSGDSTVSHGDELMELVEEAMFNGDGEGESCSMSFSTSKSKRLSSKTMRLVQWNVETLLRVLKQIVARRNCTLRNFFSKKPPNEEIYKGEEKKLVVNEIKEIIKLPKFDRITEAKQQDISLIEMDQKIIDELREFVTVIAIMYNDNPFHDFEHASHVTASVVKLLSRIVAPSPNEMVAAADSGASTLHDHTYGITSDPLTQFACILSALIHDVDHLGVPNATLVKENAQVAIEYENQSPAEQNSINLAWKVLLEDRFANLRSTIYTTEAEMKRFRALIVNSVMATDICDKSLKVLRNARWDRAFKVLESGETEDEQKAVNRKATIVIEHLIQASDVSHTMQHWHVYRKWNERFFLECYKGFRQGHAESDPCESWYKGEIGFFDFYIIPLAKKLKDCGVFGVSSDEYLNYAMKNRKEWEERGQEVVEELKQKVHEIWDADPTEIHEVDEHSINTADMSADLSEKLRNYDDGLNEMKEEPSTSSSTKEGGDQS